MPQNETNKNIHPEETPNNAQILNKDENIFAAKHRSITKTAFLLTYVTLSFLGLVTLYVHFVQQPNNYRSQESSPYSSSSSTSSSVPPRRIQENNVGSGLYEDYNCEDIFQYTSSNNMADRCLFAQTCNANEGFPFSPFIFCSSMLSTKQLLIIFCVPLFILLVLLFRMLGSTAEDYFSPSLEMFSKKFGLPPRFAGVSLLALGNGAADVSAIMSAVSSNPTTGYQMVLGSLTGGGMFIGTVVAGVVIVTAGTVTCRGALVRDVSAMAITVIVVYTEFSSGSIGKNATYLFGSLYFLFVGIVLVADVYHRSIVLPRLQARLEYKERMRQLEDEKRAKENVGEAIDNLAALENIEPKPMPNNAVSIILTTLSNYESVDEESTTVASQSTQGWGVVPDEDGMEKMITLHGKNGIITNNHHGSVNTYTEVHPDSGETPYHAMSEDIENLEIGGNADGEMFSSASWHNAFQENYQELIYHWNEYISDVFRNGNVHIIDKIFLAFEFPFTFLRQMTVPIPTDGYYCRPVIALSCAFSWLWFAIYFWLQHEVNLFQPRFWKYMLIFMGLTLTLGAAIAKFAPTESELMKLVFSGPIALYGFIIAATWIDLIADNLVNLLQFLGILFRIPSSILGITILAWGNSMGDLSANMTMAKKGLANMAMTACFAGPIFNILIGLAAGFTALRHFQDKDEIEVEMSPSITVGFIFLILNSILIIVTGVCVCDGVIPKTYGYFALALYSIYIFTTIGIQFSNS